jgi:hypothetical protein
MHTVIAMGALNYIIAGKILFDHFIVAECMHANYTFVVFAGKL